MPQPTKLPADELFIYIRLPTVSYIGSKIGQVRKQRYTVKYLLSVCSAVGSLLDLRH